MSNDIIVDGGVLYQGTDPKSRSSFNVNLHEKIKPKLAKRYLSFQKTKPIIDYFSLIKTIRNPNELISTTEVILSQRQYFPSLTYNTEIKQYPPIQKHHKLYKTHRVKNLTIEDQSKPINVNQNKSRGNDNDDMNAPLYIETFIMNRNPQCKIGNTIYTELTKRKNAYLDKLMQGNEMLPNQQPDYITQEAKKRIHCLKVNHPNTNYHDMKKIDSIPVVNTYGCNTDCNEESLYGSVSEKERYRKSTANLIRLREWINNNPDLCNAFLKEYLWRHGIYEDEYYRISKLVNLSNYLNSDFKINPKKSMKEILIEGLNYLDEEHHGTCTSDIQSQSSMRNDNKAMTQQYFTNLKRINKTIKKKKAITVNSKDEPPRISNIITDMSLQNHLYNRSAQRTTFDIINQPDQIVKLYQEEFGDEITNKKQNTETIEVPIPNSKLGLSMKKKEKIYRPKTLSTNERLFEKKRPKTDYDLVKKNNKLLEYVCYMKAKDNMQYLHLKDTLFYNKGSI